MPLLVGGGGRFSATKIDQRKKQDSALPADAAELPQEVEMSLCGHTLTFNDGQWERSGNSGENLYIFEFVALLRYGFQVDLHEQTCGVYMV
jgi:hypothetical protein